MAPLLLILFIYPLLVFSEKCARHRKPWYLLSMEEKNIYIEGFQNIRKNGKMDVITQTHATPDIVPYVHYTSLFSYYHSYLVWEVETAIRDLGGKFECFGMPLWDWTLDAGLEDNPPILSSGVGGNGLKSSHYCVKPDGTGSNWDVCDNDNDLEPFTNQCYWTPFSDYCNKAENEPYCCLKRSKSTTTILTSAAQLGDELTRVTDWATYQPMINYWHNHVHLLLASTLNSIMIDGYAPDDPTFMMLHAFVGYLRSLWADCHDYDNIDINELEISTDAYSVYCGEFDGQSLDCDDYKLGLDDKWDLYELESAPWSLAYHTNITVRKMWDNSEWNIYYELSPFYYNSGINDWCKPDSKWFVESMDYNIDEINSPINIYSQRIFNEMKNEGISLSEIFSTVSALSCDYIRKQSGNSCYDESFELISTEIICPDDISFNELNIMTLDDMVNIDGIQDNECLKQIRKEIYPYSTHYLNVKYSLCRGDFDYKCPQVEDEYKKYQNYEYVVNNIKYNNINGMLSGFWMITLGFAMCAIFGMFYFWYLSNKSKQNKLKRQYNSPISNYGST